MNEVDGQLAGVFLSAAADLGIATDPLLERLGIDRAVLVSGQRVDWADYASLLNALAEELGSAAALADVGARAIAPPYTGMVRRISAMVASPQQLYRIAHSWWGPGGWHNVAFDLSAERDALVSTWTLGKDYPDCPTHFHLARGALRALPGILGLADVRVDMELAPNQARYRIELPESRTLIARLFRVLRLPFASRAALAELGSQQAQIVRSRGELSSAHQRLLVSEARHRAVIEAVNDIVIEADASGRLLYASPSAGRFGVDPAALPGSNIWEFVHPDDLARAQVGFEDDLQAEPFVLGRQTIRVRLPTGDWVWFEVVGGRYRDASGAVRFVAVMRDARERVEVEKEREHVRDQLAQEVERRTIELERANRDLRALQTRLLQAERLGAGRDLAGSVAHPINNPLAALIGTAEMAQEREPRPELERILQLARRVDDVVARTLRLFRAGAIERAPVAPADLVRDVELQLRAGARGEGVELITKVEPGLPDVNVDRALFTAALGSIAENALDAAGMNGAISLEAGRLEDLGLVEFRIGDTGPGIPAHLRASVFEPFFTTKGGGTGLGLAIARGAIQGHEGRIRIDDRPGGGTLVVVELPLTATRPLG